MDKKKTLMMKGVWACLLTLSTMIPVSGQRVSGVQFMDKKYEYGTGKDSISLFFKVLDADGKRLSDLSPGTLRDYLVVKEDGRIIQPSRSSVCAVGSGPRIPSDFTFSVLVDRSIPASGKDLIADAVRKLVESAPDSCVFLSFFGDDVTSTRLVTRDNLKDMKDAFAVDAGQKFFYSALYAKLSEFSPERAAYADEVRAESGYVRNLALAERAWQHPEDNVLFIFTEGHRRPAYEEIAFAEVTEYKSDHSHLVPSVFAFYYTENGDVPEMVETLEGICFSPEHPESSGAYLPARDMESVLRDFERVVSEKTYDFAFTYQASPSRSYSGAVTYTAEWKGDQAGTATYSIGSPERPWPERPQNLGGTLVKLLVALLVVMLTFAAFFAIMKVIIPYFRSKAFEARYYTRYVPGENVRRRICHYCGQEIQEGQMIVKKCDHVMHVHCWRQNGYKCAEYGQNCKEGIQEHVEWRELFTVRSLRDCYQTISGIGAAFAGWVVYEWCGRGGFPGLSHWIVDHFFTNAAQRDNLYADCVGQTSAFLMIGLLLGFFLSLVFRYNDEYRKKDAKIVLQIAGLSVLTGLVGMAAFGIGAIIFCRLLSLVGTTYIPWYCSFPAYLLFSMSVAWALTWRSSIPVKSALTGGAVSAVIGFLVLLFSSLAPHRWGWMNMLLDFIIYGGGLGASIVTVRMLAEKYFLVVQNGIREGLRIPIHKWMNATGGGNKVSIGMTGDCEIQMNWEKSNKVAKEHAQLYVDPDRHLPMLKPLATGVLFNMRVELPVGKPCILSNGDTFNIGDTTFQYIETE